METQSQRAINKFVQEFSTITGLNPNFDSDYLHALESLVRKLSRYSIRPFEKRRREFLARVNSKFRLNADALRHFYNVAAHQKCSFNYHQKRTIQRAFDSRDRLLLSALLDECNVQGANAQCLLSIFDPVTEESTLAYLKQESQNPSKLRKEKGQRDIEGDIVKALFSCFMWVSVSEHSMHRLFDAEFKETEETSSFWQLLQTRSPKLFRRDHALHIVHVTRATACSFSTYSAFRASLTDLTRRLYSETINYGFLAFIVEPFELIDGHGHWELAADLTLFAEKHRESPLKKLYFQWSRIQEETLRYIPSLDPKKAQFELVNEGFSYRDCLVLSGDRGEAQHIVLIYQKNERDETPIPCPMCRSSNVEGNSYPSLGVRSWECRNPLCPDRSKYNRGKRFSFRSLIMQQAIEDERNLIPSKEVRRWTRDVVTGTTLDETVTMLMRFYSMADDGVHLHNIPKMTTDVSDRTIHNHELKLNRSVNEDEFWEGALFHRYIGPSSKSAAQGKNLGTDDQQILLGDSAEILQTFDDCTFDGAVTSPPYYNARDYSQWPNIYCYLNDMLAVNTQVFRTLKPGALYLYNIFDYFDNENTVALSAMGQKRMILSAYTIDLFRRIGFRLLGNTVWDKGDIEGKRGFNAGNFSSYYQSPFNCWEHILIFQKPRLGDDRLAPNIPISDLMTRVLRHPPVFKMVRGLNVNGHSAPFPEKLPELIVARLPKGSIVLDPFAGSLTTGRVAERYAVRSVCIEKSLDYCKIGIRMRRDNAQPALFKSSRAHLKEKKL